MRRRRLRPLSGAAALPPAAERAAVQRSIRLHLLVLQNTLRYGYFKATVQRLVKYMATCPTTVWAGLNQRADWCGEPT